MNEKEKLEDELLDRLKEMKGPADSSGRRKIGLVEEVWIRGSRREKKVQAKVDTGASKSCISKELFDEIGKTPDIGKVLVASSMAEEERPVVELLVSIQPGKWVRSSFTVASRGSMKYPLLIGKNTILKMNVIVDPGKGM